MRVAIYARFSITDQLALAREYAVRQGWQIIAEFTDAAISGASMVNRPGLNELMRAAEARNFDVVLTESLDRLSRDLADSAGLHRQLVYWGVRIVTLADGDVNKMLVAVKGLLECPDSEVTTHLAHGRPGCGGRSVRWTPECRRRTWSSAGALGRRCAVG